MSIIGLIKALLAFGSGVIATLFYFGNPFTDPFILEIFISNETHSDAPIGFKVTNMTQHSLKTDINITSIVNDEEYDSTSYSKVLNPNEMYVVNRLEGDYRYIRHINAKHNLNATNYENNRQPLKFELKAHFDNNRLFVTKIHNYTEIVCAYDPKSRTFIRIK